MQPLELWGGLECTIVRIGNEYRDQIAETGHRDRLSDLDLLVELGIRAVRYPILWESVATDRPDQFAIEWHEQRLERLRELGIRVIGGLVHHGSGPRYTDLLDPDFPRLLGDYASRVAKHFPWIEDWTPVNEPLTTARFSCLYGHWYPHQRSMEAMFRALANECAGTLLAMREIRKHVSNARLVVTEDLGKTFSTPALTYQAEHENERRWLSLDLLCGRVDSGHPFHGWMLESGVPEHTLSNLESGEARPDVIGINHYLTSERYLDERTELYPDLSAGSNGRDIYVDAEAVRIPELKADVGTALRLKEAWERYGIPLAITEVHHGCTRDEQVRWLCDVWSGAEQARQAGVDVRAVTLWSMFGAFDWRSLLTLPDGHYDCGPFDIRSPAPRPTLLAKAAHAIGQSGSFSHPVLDTPGWWQRPGRFYCARTPAAANTNARPVLITGATGTLGQAFSRLCDHRGLAHVLTGRPELDISDDRSVAAAIERHKPWAVINAAGYVRVPDAERERGACFRANAHGAERLAIACAKQGLPLVTFSSDLVFDGQLGRSYREIDPTNPACVYGHSKAAAERLVLASCPDALVIRTSAFFGPWDTYNFLRTTLDRLSRGEEVEASGTVVVSATYVPDLVHAALDLLLDDEAGVWHLANEGSVSWHQLACEVADRRGFDPRSIRETNGLYADTSLTSDRGTLLRPLESALSDFVAYADGIPLGDRVAVASVG